MVHSNTSIGRYKVIRKKVYILENVFRNVIMCVEKDNNIISFCMVRNYWRQSSNNDNVFLQFEGGRLAKWT